ncbi:MAG: hypothetical protein WC794_00065 [Candidatus Doudnabacteria bacterium]|jgi:hypothetical protein
MTFGFRPHEAPNRTMRDITEKAQSRKIELSRIIRQHLDEIFAGSFTDKDLINTELGFQNEKALGSFLWTNFGSKLLIKVAQDIQKIDSIDTHTKNAPEPKKTEIKPDKEKLTSIILLECSSKMSSIVLAKKIEDLIASDKLPTKTELYKIFFVKSVRELSTVMLTKWQLKNLK